MKYLFCVLFGVVAYLLQIFLAPSMAIAGIRPDFILIYLACITPYFGIFSLPLISVSLGAAIDLTTSGGLFLNTAIYFVVSLGLAGVKLFDIDLEFVPSVIAVGAGALFDGIVKMVALYILELTPNLSFVYFLKCIPAGLYTLILMVPFYFLFRWLFNIKILKKYDRTILDHRKT